MKRIFDFIVSLIGLIILSPLILIISLAILISMGQPILFCQVRIGRGGREFKIIKFRTMVKNAENRGPVITVSADSRITPLGRSLRRYKLDEIPQLVNVIKGDMALVGPRPEVPRYVQLYNNLQRQVLNVRPGITDLATLAYRNEESILAQYDDREKAYIEIIMPDKLSLNIQYLEKRSFRGDLAIILKTIINIFKPL